MQKFPFLILALALPLAAQADTLPAPTAKPCRAQAMGRALDFWIGDWVVTNVADGSPSGTNRIERKLDGCAVTEDWHGADVGDDGMSLFTYDAQRQVWEQVWVAQDTSHLGGLKHKTADTILPGGAMQFEGTLVGPKFSVLDRTTLTPLKDGRLRQTIQLSKDHGANWKVVFDAYYTRKG
jgi:hypothetical protein